MHKKVKSIGRLLLPAALLLGVAPAMQIYAAPAPLTQQAENTATGVVKDEFGDPMIGAVVKVAGNPTQSDATNENGEFTIANVKTGQKLEITSFGYKPLEVVWQGTPIDVTMDLDSETLDTVVVTAMGITRESKSLTYAAQTIKSGEVTRVKEVNFINALQGKSAGLTITPNNTGAGGGASRIELRGSSSILGTNQPLIVLDGVPLQNGMGSQATDLGFSGERSGDDLLSTINPEDIENMTILKGPNAAALYGSAANNGVIIITTKSGAAGAARVSFSSSTSVDRMALWPAQQQLFGITDTGNFTHSQWSAWGPLIGTRLPDDVASNPYMMNSPRVAAKDFFQTGVTLNNAITISGGTELSRSFFSYNNTYQEGLIPNNTFMRHNVMFKESFAMFNKRLNINASINWIHQKTKNAPVTGKALSSLFALYRTPADIDMRYFKNHYSHVGTAGEYLVSDPVIGNPKLLGQPIQTWGWFVEYLNNPYWVANMVNSQQNRDRILGNVTMTVDIWNNLKFQTRLNVDYVLNNNLEEEYATMFRAAFDYKGGKYYSSNSRSSDIYNDYMLTWIGRVKEVVELNLAAGGSFNRHFNRSTNITTAIDTCGVANAFVPQNCKHSRPGNPNGSATSAYDSWNYKDWGAALFATASVGLYDKVFVDGSYRLEWAQAFQQFTQKGGYKSFDYYSAGVNVLLDKFLPHTVWLDRLKWRGSWSVVGNAIPNTLFARQSLNFSTGVVSARPPLFDDPKPETTTSFETGFDIWLFNNKLNFDITYYNSTLRNQFLYVSTASGESKPVNTGKIRNQGIEFTAGYRWYINNDWQWQTGFNIAYNDNKILETYVQPDGTPYTYMTGPNSFKVKYIEGGKFGDLYVNSFKRDADGRIMISGGDDLVNGVPVMASGTYDTKVGNTTSPVRLGWNNTFFWRDLSLYILIDGRIGGKVMSLTESDLDRFGISTRSAQARMAALNDPNNLITTDHEGNTVYLMYLPDGSTYKEGDKIPAGSKPGDRRKISVQRYYETVGAYPMEEHVYDATSFRVRDITLAYQFPNLLGLNKGLTAQFSVKNAFFIYKKAPVDPDISVSAANGFSGLDSYALPTTRSFVFTIKLDF